MINGGACISLLTKKTKGFKPHPRFTPLSLNHVFFHKKFFLIILSSSPNTDFSKKHGTGTRGGGESRWDFLTAVGT